MNPPDPPVPVCRAGAGPTARLNPATVRTHQFPTRRRGADPTEVREFLEDVANELAALHRKLILVNQENERLKRTLRDWQSMYANQTYRPEPRSYQPEPQSHRPEPQSYRPEPQSRGPHNPRPAWPVNPAGG